ncbi:MAG: hypothetical protein DRJ52_03700 [Thermoprotei archaeon]|nr:MAG: hypothetical protein DRJ52_03700 [Thermoprotei archaeon]HDI75119.1 GNAT family N-acetyltransferase [Thermoprotei archaeon]
MRFIIREPKTIEDFYAIMHVQKEAWGMREEDIVPAHFLKAIADNGGVVFVAADEEGKIVGFVLGILASKDSKTYHYSHMVAVLPEYRGKGIAYRLKLAQREKVLRQGLDLIMWTYDPLQGLNANFNFRKLGVICRLYYRNYYGEMRDQINIGLPSDRFKVEWWIKSPRVTKKLSGSYPSPTLKDLENIAESVVETEVIKGIRVVENITLDSSSEVLLVEIPESISKVRDIDLKLALEWRLKTRELFEHYFRREYIAVDFISIKENNLRRNFYILWKTSLEKVLKGETPWR